MLASLATMLGLSLMRQRLIVFGILLVLACTAPAQEQDMSGVGIKTARLADNLYLLQGAGGNISASVGAHGVLLVDDEFAPLADKIRAALRRLGAADRPMRFIINTPRQRQTWTRTRSRKRCSTP